MSSRPLVGLFFFGIALGNAFIVSYRAICESRSGNQSFRLCRDLQLSFRRMSYVLRSSLFKSLSLSLGGPHFDTQYRTYLLPELTFTILFPFS
jgi:hypothetical protein